MVCIHYFISNLFIVHKKLLQMRHKCQYIERVNCTCVGASRTLLTLLKHESKLQSIGRQTQTCLQIYTLPCWDHGPLHGLQIGTVPCWDITVATSSLKLPRVIPVLKNWRCITWKVPKLTKSPNWKIRLNLRNWKWRCITWNNSQNY